MTPEQEQHMQSIGSIFIELMEKKYKTGQKEHGGNLWEKKGIIDMAIDEAIDQVVYLLTLKSQLDNKVYYQLTKEDDAPSR